MPGIRGATGLRITTNCAYNILFDNVSHGAAILRIVKYPHPVLKHLSRPLKRVDAELRKWIAEMFELMYEHKGIGLAANQVDLPYRVFILNVSGDAANKDQEHVLINPTILKQSGNAEADEGCLSFPEIYAPVRRSENVVAVAYDLCGNEKKYDVDGLFARALQHEYDHIDGKLFIDRLTPSHLANIRDDLLDLEAEFNGDRERGVIPDDQQIAARLAELERQRT
jgi:peptide deformylase